MQDLLPYGVIVLLLSCFLSVGITRGIIAMSRRLGRLDQPNARSSHSIPTPRGGGLAIVICVLLATAYWGGASAEWLALILSSGLIAATGLIDDIKGLSAKFRFVIQFAAAFIFLALVERPLLAPPLGVFSDWSTYGLLALFLVWMTNLYNFMDGIDGMASIQAIVVSTALAAFSDSGPTAMIYLTLSGASLGFFWYNRSPAKIFMGDSGSGFIGFFLGAFAILNASPKMGFQLPLETTIIMLAVFIVDATTTVIIRLLTGYDPTKPHREFGFHHFVRSGHTHREISILYSSITLFGCVPMAFFADTFPQYAAIAVIATYIPLIATAMFFTRSGQKLVESNKGRSIQPPIQFGGLNIESTEDPAIRSRRVLKVRLYRANPSRRWTRKANETQVRG